MRRRVQARLAMGLAVVMALMVMVSPTATAEGVDWTGVWDTQWRDGGAVMELQQEGSQVSGTYPGFDGVIEAVVQGNELSGTWADPSGDGIFTFVMSPDQQSFMGRFGTGEWWTGVRLNADAGATPLEILDASSPRQMLRSFLQIGNQASEGRSDRLGIVVPLLDYSAFEDPLSPYQRVDLARLLFQIIDRLTFRIWEIRPVEDSSTEEYTVELTQAGSDLTYTLTFRAGADGNEDGGRTWRLVVPPEEEMRASLRALLEIHDGVLPHSRQHYELQSPRDTMRTFLEQWDNARLGQSDLFLNTMDLSQIAAVASREDEGALLGEYLIEVLYRIGLPLFQEIPDNPNRRGPYTHFVHPVGSVEIHPIEQEDGSIRWQFSADTMARVRQLFIALEDMPMEEDARLVESTPFFALRHQVRSIHRELLHDSGAGMELWQWLALGFWLLISIPLSWLLTWMVAKLFQFKKNEENRALSPEIRFLWPLRLIFIASLGLLSLRTLGLPQAVDIPLRVIIGATLSITGGWLLYHLVDKASRTLADHARRYRYKDEILRSLVTSLIKISVIIGAFLLLAEILSLPYQGVIAGLGIGGLAVALAARSTLENLIGAITLFADKPVEVGDFCKLGDHQGIIEGIGLRSVKVRSLDRTIITIPNAEFINLSIENLSRRDTMLLHTTIGLRYETTPDQLRWVLTGLRQLLLQHPMVTPEPARARFRGFGDYSVDIELFAYLKTTDVNEFLGIQEDIFLRLITIVHESGTDFAFPSMVNYLANDSGVDQDRTDYAEAMVQKLRENNELPFPNLGLQTCQNLQDTLDYPPKGSIHYEDAPKGT